MLSLHEIESHLKSCGYTPQYLEETDQLCLTLRKRELDLSLFFRIHEKAQLLQLAVFLPLKLTPQRFDTLGRFLHLINKEIDLPGFGLDEDHQLIFYRLMLPPLKDNLLSGYIESTAEICACYLPLLAFAVQSNVNFNELLDQLHSKVRV